MENVIVIIVILIIVAVASAKIYSEKKKGAKCVGCPYSQSGAGCNCSKTK